MSFFFCQNFPQMMCRHPCRVLQDLPGWSSVSDLNVLQVFIIVSSLFFFPSRDFEAGALGAPSRFPSPGQSARLPVSMTTTFFPKRLLPCQLVLWKLYCSPKLKWGYHSSISWPLCRATLPLHLHIKIPCAVRLRLRFS